MRRLEESYKRAGLAVPIFFDSDRQLTAALNAYYRGRLSYFTSDWRLRWLEHDGRIDNYLFKTGRFDRLMEEGR